MSRWPWFVLGSVLAVGSSCARSPTGRPQLLLVDDAEMARMGAAAFADVKSETPVSRDPAKTSYVRCVADALTKVAAPDVPWQVEVFDSPEVNAFALPGGKIGVFTGLLGVAKTQDELAAVLGHEVAHVVARHGNARVSAAMATEAGVTLTSAAVGAAVPESRNLLGLLGVGAQLGVLMPYGRDQETEADILGLGYMADAGFDPKGALELWRNMKEATGDGPPTFLSTHPSHEGRIEELSKILPRANERYEAARQKGRAPRCGGDQ